MARKRTAEEELKTPKAKKTQLSKFGIVPKAIRNIFSPSANSLAEEDVPDDAGTPSPEVPAAKPLTALEEQRRVAQAIDDRFAVIEEKRADAALKDPARLLRWNIEIKPADDEYQAVRAMLQAELREESVLTVVTNHFEDAQRLLIQPPPRDGLILKIQRQNGEEYKKALAVGGTFEGEKNNLTTKLTMLYFGLPVEAMTLNNILNAGMKDVDDEEDTPDDLPRVQRIKFSEKPLQFLDEYHERSYGFPMLRRPKSQTTRMIIQPNKNPSITVPSRHGAGAKRGGAHMRGGAGPTTNSIPLYGPGVSRLSVPKVALNHETFKDAALRLLGWDKDKPFEFTIDQYNNQETKKLDQEKNFVRSFTVTDQTYQDKWTEFLKTRFTNSLQDWPLRVVSRAEEEKPDPTFVLPTSDASYLRNIPQQPATPSGTKPPTGSTSGSPPLPKKEQLAPYQGSRPIYNLRHIPALVSSPGSIDAANFRRTVATLLSRPEIDNISSTSEPWSFKVSFYRDLYSTTPIKTQAGQPSRHLYRTFVIEKSAYLQTYTQEIRPRLFSKDGGQAGLYLVVVHNTTEKEPSVWPTPVPPPGGPPAVKPETPPVQVPDRPTKGSGEGTRPLYTHYSDINAWDLLHVEDHIEAFLRAAQQLLDFDENDDQWSFFVDLYNRQNGADPETYTVQTAETIKVTKSTLVQDFANIRDFLLDTTEMWAISVRNDDQPQQAQARLTDERICVHGYRGQVWTSPNTKSFRQTIHQLLGLNKHMEWTVTVDHLEDQNKSFNLGSAHYDSTQSSQLLQDSFKALAGNANDKLFIRFATKPRPSSWDPWEPWVDGVSNFVVKLDRPKVSMAYWKIPMNIKQLFGINQVQKGFRDAMRVLFPAITPSDDGFSRPAQNIIVDIFDIGFGGMEVTNVLWGRVKRMPFLKKTNTLWEKPWVVKLQLDKKEGDPERGSEIATGIRLIGSQHLAYAYHSDAAKIYSEMQTLVTTYLDPTLPEMVRVWKHASSRETEATYIDESIPIKLGATEKDAAIAAIQGLLNKGSRRTNCLFFRPEWQDFIVSKTPSGTRNWHPEHGKKLHHFRDDVLEELFKGDDILKQNSTKAFYLSVADPKSALKFVVDPTMPDGKLNNEPDEEWRTGIFDWFHSKRINAVILKSDDPVLKLDFDGSPWGVAIETLETLTPPPTTVVINPPLAKPAPRYTKLNQPRIRAPRAAPVKTEKFVKWNAKQRYEDSLQQKSYHTDQSVIEPGQKPQAPIFGLSKELEFNIGASFPGVYVQRITPTDVMEIMDENKSLQNQVLERMATCIICQASFAKYKLDEISAHCYAHLQQLYIEGACPTCGNGSWSLWTPEEKRQHQAVHASITESAEVKKFWNQLYCPCCDKELDSLGGPKAILYHMAEHQPGSIQYCDRCGLHVTSCDKYELSHHRDQCMAKDDRPPGSSNRWFCDSCGKDRTAGTETEIKDHRRTCGVDKGAWCDVCGLNITYLSTINVGRHKARCKPPGGYDRKFCAKCGENLEIKDARGLEYHKQTCFNSENSSNLLQLTNGQDAQAVSIAVQEERGKLWAKEQDLKYRENNMHAAIQDALNKIGTDPQELADTKGLLDRARTQVATHEANVAVLTQQLQDNNVDTAINEPCPFPDCKTDIKAMTRQNLVDHFKPHGITFRSLRTDKNRGTTALADTEAKRKSLESQLITSQGDLATAIDALKLAQDALANAPGSVGQGGNDDDGGLQAALDAKFIDLNRLLNIRKAADPTKVYITQTPRPRPGESPADFNRRAGLPNPPTIEEKIRKRPGETAIDRDTRVRAANIDWVLRTAAKEFVCTRANFDNIMLGVTMPESPDWNQRIHDADFREYNRLRAAENPQLPIDDGSAEAITDFGFPSSPMKKPRKVRGSRATSATLAPTTKRKRVASTTPGPDLGPAPKTPKRAPGRPRRKAVVEEEDEEEFVARDEEESEVPLTSPSKRVTRRSPSKRG